MLADINYADMPSARRAMIDCQLRPSGVNDGWVLAAMAALPREDFVPAAMRGSAYIDRAIALGDGRWLASPLVHARMLVEARPGLADKALLIGDAAGYLAALLRPLVGALDVAAPGSLADLPGADYTLLIIDGAAEQLPDGLTAALGEGGRLVCGMVTTGVNQGVTRLGVGRKVAGHVALLPLADLGMPILPEFAVPRRWSF